MHPRSRFGKRDLRPFVAAGLARSRQSSHSLAMNRPWISANFAISADGKITNVAQRPSGWTSKADHARFLALRKGADALLVGRGTLEADRMTMTVPDQEEQPLRCVVSSKGRISPDHPLFQTAAGPIHILATEGAENPDLPGATFHQGSLADFLEETNWCVSRTRFILVG